MCILNWNCQLLIENLSMHVLHIAQWILHKQNWNRDCSRKTSKLEAVYMRRASPVERTSSWDQGSHFTEIQFVLPWKKNIVYMKTIQPRLAGSPFEEARAPFKQAGICHINSPAQLTGLIFHSSLWVSWQSIISNRPENQLVCHINRGWKSARWSRSARLAEPAFFIQTGTYATRLFRVYVF